MKLTDKMYNALKFVALVLLPALSALYVALGNVWDFPNIEQVVGTLTAIDTFLGLVLKVSSSSYAQKTIDGEVVVGQVDGETHTATGIKESVLPTLHQRDTITLKVEKVGQIDGTGRTPQEER